MPRWSRSTGCERCASRPETCRCLAPFSCPVGDCGCRALLCEPSDMSFRGVTCRGYLLAWSTLLWCEVVVSCLPSCVAVC